MNQISYVMVKPEFANDQRVINYVKKRIEQCGLKIVNEAEIRYDTKSAQKHYAEHFLGSYENCKPFYPNLEKYITSDKAYGIVVEGENAISVIREILGFGMKIDKQTGAKVLPPKGTIRYEVPVMLGIEHDMVKNVVHASDKEESAKNEIEVFNSLAYGREIQE